MISDVWSRGAAGGPTGRRETSSDEVQFLAAPPPQNEQISVKFSSIVTSAFSCEDAGAVEGRGRFFKPPKTFRKFSTNLTLPARHALYPKLMDAGNQFAAAFKKRFGEAGGEYSFDRRDGRKYAGVRAYAYGRQVVVPEIQTESTFHCEDVEQVLAIFSDEVRDFSGWATPQLPRIARLSFEVGAKSELRHLKFPRRHSVVEIGFGSSSLQESSVRMAEFLTKFRRQAISSHIALSPTAVVDPRLERELINSNSSLNLKSESHLLMLNAQGSLFMRNAGSHAAVGGEGLRGAPYENRFENVVSLSQIALLLQHLGLTAVDLSEFRSDAWAGSSNAYRLWVKYPENALYRSVGNFKIWEVLQDAYRLGSIYEEAMERFPELRAYQWV